MLVLVLYFSRLFSVFQDLSTSSGLGKLSGSSTSLNKPPDRSRSGSMQSVESINIIHGSENDLAIRHLFDQVLYFSIYS